MADDVNKDAEKSTVPSRKLIIFIVISALALAVIAAWISNRKKEEDRQEAIATAEGIAKVINETLADRTTLIVQDAKGALDVTAVDRSVFDTWQRSTVPYSVQYTVDLSRLTLAKIKYDQESRTMLVEIPPVSVSRPDIDENKKVITGRGGLWTSRNAGERLAARTTKLATAGATQSANKPEKVAAASELARAKVDQLLELPLRASGQGGLNVVVRLATDGVRQGEQWDVSPSIEQVLARRDAE